MLLLRFNLTMTNSSELIVCHSWGSPLTRGMGCEGGSGYAKYGWSNDVAPQDTLATFMVCRNGLSHIVKRDYLFEKKFSLSLWPLLPCEYLLIFKKLSSRFRVTQEWFHLQDCESDV